MFDFHLSITIKRRRKKEISIEYSMSDNWHRIITS